VIVGPATDIGDHAYKVAAILLRIRTMGIESASHEEYRVVSVKCGHRSYGIERDSAAGHGNDLFAAAQRIHAARDNVGALNGLFDTDVLCAFQSFLFVAHDSVHNGETLTGSEFFL
jgi:hypothetical protein